MDHLTDWPQGFLFLAATAKHTARTLIDSIIPRLILIENTDSDNESPFTATTLKDLMKASDITWAPKLLGTLSLQIKLKE